MNNDTLVQLAAAQALYHELGRMVRTGDPDNLRGRADALLADGVTDRIKLSINGKSVGTLSARWSKPRRYLRVDDREAFADWCMEDGSRHVRQWIAEGMRGSLADYCMTAIVTDGEVPAGCELVDEPEHMDGTVIRGCKLDDVADALGQHDLMQAGIFALTGEVRP